MLVKIPQNSVSQSNEQVIGAEVDDSKPSTSNLATLWITIAQLYLQSQIDFLNSDLFGLYNQWKRGMLMQEQDGELKEKKKKYELGKKLKKKSDKKKHRKKEMRRKKI